MILYGYVFFEDNRFHRFWYDSRNIFLDLNRHGGTLPYGGELVKIKFVNVCLLLIREINFP